ncbi:hypothetical protein FRACYDRAFT_270472 [Fragilariopsis cylindrus CCMP1102]|uniref:Ubiquitin-like modifier-activating enzyme ATG7 n=1 Tax=Fragilariopsis cylindrus CCMP1102 TaxID=635003 RepID=A0A1E7F3R3_9STRA|nr:hypothetical protein FRACYDRAFT_270472 [Fragilariopsis cylindrus CCMP1102]|eukprot:OEU12764.1 hypothetical protein FRACYDRAFT_270472 [Fragilariopsis cylindrus CCMP1102]
MKIKLPLRDDYDYSNNNDDVDKTASTVATTSAPPAAPIIPPPVPPPHYKVVGWELNIRQKPGPRWVNLRPLLDKNHLAIQAADLNLKLMKWRMIPDLDVDTLQNSTKVLLLGAGTLGCSVSRTLLGWGIRNFKFVDYGNVSYSNPVRQILFNLKDCHYGNSQGKPKAQAAADALKKIAPDVVSEGIQLCIPMPGHAYDENNTTSTLHETVQQLDQLIQDSDVIFLLTDTRESRWLPTVMAAVHDKILINAALGLDSWLVMRHGCGDNDVKDHNHNQNQQENNDGSSETSLPPPAPSSPSSNRLGCYFCNDVVAPENSTRNRTLDQQCTVTRPGLAPIASSMAVELFVSLLHHPQRQRAPAPPVQKNNSSSNNSATYSPTDNSDSSSSSPLGIIPHQIRGSIVTYTMMTPSVPAFVYCTGCSSAILDEYRKDKFELVSRTCSSIDGSSHLENLSGLTQFRAEAAEKIAEMENDYWDDEDDDNEF